MSFTWKIVVVMLVETGISVLLPGSHINLILKQLVGFILVQLTVVFVTNIMIHALNSKLQS